MKRILFIVLCVVAPLMVMAQSTRPVRGVVFNAEGIPMPGVTLKAVGSTESVTSKEDGTFDMMVSPYAKFVEASKEDFISVRLEIDGSYLVFRLALDKRYIEAKAKAEEQARLAAAAAAEAEKARIEEERRIAAEKAAAEREAMLRAEQERLAAEARAKAEEERRIAAEKAAAEKARIAEEKRIAAEKAAAEKAEAARLAAEEKARIAEEKRIAAEKAAAEKAEAARIAAEEKKRQEEEKARLAEEKRLAAEKAAAEKAEQDRLAAEERSKLAEKERLAAAEKARVVAEAERAKRAEAERLAAEEKARIAEEKARIAEAKRIAAEKAAAEKQKKVDARNAYVKEWKDAKLKGYRSQVEALFALDFDLMCNCNVHYIGGFQINNLFYVGVGAGVSLYLNDVETPRWSKTDYIDAANLPLNLWSIPVFAYFRANFANRRLTPFFALAAGYRFGTKHTFDMPWDSHAEYSTSGIFINPQIGLNFRMTKKSDIYITGGFNFMQMPQFDAANSTMFEAKFYNQFYRGFDLRLGFTF